MILKCFWLQKPMSRIKKNYKKILNFAKTSPPTIKKEKKNLYTPSKVKI